MGRERERYQWARRFLRALCQSRSKRQQNLKRPEYCRFSSRFGLIYEIDISKLNSPELIKIVDIYRLSIEHSSTKIMTAGVGN